MPPGYGREVVIRLKTLGSVHCLVGESEKDLLARPVHLALLTYLAHQGRARRAVVAALLWPDADASRATHALARTITELDRVLGPDWLDGGPEWLQIGERVRLDTNEFEALVRTGSLTEALALYRGDFLAGIASHESAAFQDWVDRRRRELKHLFHHAARERVQQLTAAGDTDVAVEEASRWVGIQPLDDEANHTLIETLIAAGERADALAHFSAYEKRIRDELGMRPLDRTFKLIEQLRIGTSQSAERTPAEAAGDVRVVGTGASFFGELTRRRVLRMAGWYAASLFVVLQSVQILQEALYLPPGLLTGTALVGLFGFPVALLLSWQFDLTPEGIRRTDWTKKSGQRALSRGDWRVVSISMLMILASTVAAFSTSTVRSLLVIDRTPPVMCPDGSPAPCRNAIAMEPNRFAVLPLWHQQDAKPGLLDGELCARLLSEGLSQWRDINIADPLRLNEALQRMPEHVRQHIPVDSGMAIAREVGAGKLIMGEIWHHGDTTRVRAQLYDVSTAELIRSRQTQFRSVSSNVGVEFYGLAQEMLLEGVKVSTPEVNAANSVAALLAYDAAWKAIRRWDLERARHYFEAATRHDTAYSYAHLWLAHVMLWQADTAPAWRYHAERAAAAGAPFGAQERLMANGIAALATQRFDDACESYRALLARDSSSFQAWYGLSECLAGNRSVRRDADSPSGWAFESSYEEAIRAHQHALQLVPSFNEAFVSLGSSRLADLLFLSPTEYRSGVADDSASLYFAARPELIADTIRFIPYPHEEWSRQPVPANNAALIARHRVILRQAAMTWAGAFPNNRRALAALAFALEQTGEIERSASSPNAALDVVRRARMLENGAAPHSRLAVTEIRLLFKAGRFKDARVLARATLKDVRPADADDARRLAGVAGLIGRPHEMARLLVLASRDFDYDRPEGGEAVEVPHELAAATSALLGYAYVGAPRDSLRVLMSRAHEILARSVAPEQRKVMHAATLDRAARMLFPIVGPDEVHRPDASLFLRMQSLLWSGDTKAVRQGLAELAALQQTLRPTDPAADGILTIAQLYVAVGDTARAIRMLDGYLNDLPGVPQTNFRQPYQPVSIVRLMQLRAELAIRTNDPATARKWGRAVVDLWQNGDREVRSVVQRMRSLARAR